MQQFQHVIPNWLPVRFRLSPSAVAVKWMDFGSKQFSEPFFHQTVRKLRSGTPAAPERITSLSVLLEMAKTLTPLTPAGIIFHVSRCGSTLLANALKTGHNTVVLAEASPIGLFLRPGALNNSPFPKEGRRQARRMLLDSVVSLYGHDALGQSKRLVIKCHTISLLDIAKIRSIWPSVPFVVLIRDPVEVIVSNLAKPAGWLRGRKHVDFVRRAFNWPDLDVTGIPVEEYCARVMSRFFESAALSSGADCRILDYSDINAARIREIANFFGIQFPPGNDEMFRKAVSTYSKDPEQQRSFQRDEQTKRERSSDAIRKAVEEWALNDYLRVKHAAAVSSHSAIANAF